MMHSRMKQLDSFWQELPIRLDRIPNDLNGVPALWQAMIDKEHSMNSVDRHMCVSKLGNFNEDGSTTSFTSAILGMRHPKLLDFIEPRIRPLVEFLASHGFVTYSSCEGHFDGEHLHEAYVGLLYSSHLRDCTSQLAFHALQSGFTVFRTVLRDTDDSTLHPTIELYFPRRDDIDIASYHKALEVSIGTLQDY